MKHVQDYWESKEYIDISSEASRRLDHLGIEWIFKKAKTSKKILDVGCSDGTRLNLLVGKGQKGWGVDVSKTAISFAKRKYPHLNFSLVYGESLPFKDRFFDLVYSAFVLEHVKEPQKVIDEALRVLDKKGSLILLAPNFGSPNRASPNWPSSRFIKLISGFFNDLKIMFLRGKRHNLGWKNVSPRKNVKYEIDIDTTVEPYLFSLIKYLQSKGNLEIEYSSSLWELDAFSIFQLPFRILGLLNIPPFVWWGPQILVVVRKKL